MAAPKGHPKWGGRKKGTRNKYYLDPNVWMGKFEEMVNEQDPVKRMESIKFALNLMFSKMQVLPRTPGDSVDNANEAFEELKRLEAPKTSQEPESK